MMNAANILRAMWSNQSVANKLWTIFNILAFPLLFWAAWVIIP